MHLAVLAEAARDSRRPGCPVRTADPPWPAGPRRSRRSPGPGRRPGGGGLLLVTGEGGIGKTRLAAELETGRPPAGR